MKKLIALTAIATAALMVNSCKPSDTTTETETTPPAAKTSGDTVESLAKETATKMTAFTDAIVSAKDKASAEKAAASLKTIGGELVALSERLSKLEKPSNEARKAIAKDMKVVEDEMGKKMMEAMPTIMGNEEVAPIITAAMEGFGDKMEKAGKIFETYFEGDEEAPAPAPITPPTGATAEPTPPTPAPVTP